MIQKTPSHSTNEVGVFVCELLEILQQCNKLCWKVSAARDILRALVGMDCATSQGRNRRHSLENVSCNLKRGRGAIV